jgi:hypothetical protein
MLWGDVGQEINRQKTRNLNLKRLDETGYGLTLESDIECDLECPVPLGSEEERGEGWVFDRGLEVLVAVDRSHGFDEEEGSRAGEKSDEHEGC